jgi:hypothetical protein
MKQLLLTSIATVSMTLLIICGIIVFAVGWLLEKSLDLPVVMLREQPANLWESDMSKKHKRNKRLRKQELKQQRVAIKAPVKQKADCFKSDKYDGVLKPACGCKVCMAKWGLKYLEKELVSRAGLKFKFKEAASNAL